MTTGLLFNTSLVWFNSAKNKVTKNQTIIGFNDTKDARRGCEYGIHAEMDVLGKFSRIFSRKRNYKNMKRIITRNLLVIRIDRNGNLKESRPCCKCLEILYTSRSCRIQYVYYSTSDGTIVREKFRDLYEKRNEYHTRRFIIRNA